MLWNIPYGWNQYNFPQNFPQWLHTQAKTHIQCENIQCINKSFNRKDSLNVLVELTWKSNWIVQFFTESEESDYHLISEPQGMLKWAQNC